ncbi:MAG: hypothetical protein WEC17_02200 [Candidatus Saccharimonadales bacterium]
MTGINHAITGALVVVSIKQPAIALPAAFLSHFAIDILPHWDYKVPGPARMRRLVIATDLLVSIWLIVLVAALIPDSGWLALAGGFLAITPDSMWLPYILHGGPSPVHKKTPLHLARRFHSKIQWSETPIGLVVEIIWFVLMLLLLVEVSIQ